MTYEEKLKIYNKAVQIPEKEEAVQKTIQVSKAAFYDSERDKVVPYHEFLLAQFRIMRKRWWSFQILVLMLFWISFRLSVEMEAVQRSLGVTAALFIILVIPELWKNRDSQSMEIEAASYYSLRQIYAARMTLFGIVDVALVTMFCCQVSITLNLAMLDLLTQFLFPMVVTACICFGVLCSRYNFSEFAAIGICMIWGVLWWLLVLNEEVYMKITIPVWGGLIGTALIFLIFVVHRTLNSCSQYWEVSLNGIEN